MIIGELKSELRKVTRNPPCYSQPLGFDFGGGGVLSTIETVVICVDGIAYEGSHLVPRKNPVTVTLTDGREIKMSLGEAEAIGKCAEWALKEK